MEEHQIHLVNIDTSKARFTDRKDEVFAAFCKQVEEDLQDKLSFGDVIINESPNIGQIGEFFLIDKNLKVTALNNYPGKNGSAPKEFECFTTHDPRALVDIEDDFAPIRFGNFNLEWTKYADTIYAAPYKEYVFIADNPSPVDPYDSDQEVQYFEIYEDNLDNDFIKRYKFKLPVELKKICKDKILLIHHMLSFFQTNRK